MNSWRKVVAQYEVLFLFQLSCTEKPSYQVVWPALNNEISVHKMRTWNHHSSHSKIRCHLTVAWF